MRYRRILAAVDGSPRAPAVVQAAREIASRFDGHVHLFRAVDLAPEIPPAARTTPDRLEELLSERARADLLALAGDDLRVTIEAPLVGPTAPWRAILDAAARIQADLVVIGSHGYGGWDRLLGTTAARVANRADRDVLVVHEPASAGPPTPEGSPSQPAGASASTRRRRAR